MPSAADRLSANNPGTEPPSSSKSASMVATSVANPTQPVLATELLTARCGPASTVWRGEWIGSGGASVSRTPNPQIMLRNTTKLVPA